MIGLHRAIRLAAIGGAVAMPFLLVRPVARPVPARRLLAIASLPPGETGPPLFAEAGGDAVVAPSVAAPPQPLGIVGRLPDDGRALVRLADGSVRTLAIGDEAQGWRLGAIAPDRLVFRRGGEARTLVLPIAAAGEDQ